MLSDPISKICATVIIVAALVVVAVLTWHGSLTGGQALAVITAIIGIPAALFAHNTSVQAALGVRAPVNRERP